MALSLRHLRIVAFRSLREIEFAPPPSVTLIEGDNAQGKTSVLEAIRYLSTGRSFRTARDRECLPEGHMAGAFVQGTVLTRDIERSLAVQLTTEGKALAVDGRTLRSLSELLGIFPTVLVQPEDLELIRGGPGERRRYLDAMLAQMDTAALRAMGVHAQALKGRNALLRRRAGVGDREYAAFEQLLAEAGTTLSIARKALLERLEPLVAGALERISGGRDSLSLLFEAGGPLEVTALAEKLARTREADLSLGSTQCGAHRDDFAIVVERRDARRFASQGQCRSLSLALRLGESRALAESLGDAPTLLMDDILGELDAERTRRTFEELRTLGAQVFLAATPAQHAQAGFPAAERLRLHGGKLLPAGGDSR